MKEDFAYSSNGYTIKFERKKFSWAGRSAKSNQKQVLTLFYYVFKSSPGGFTKCAQSSLNFHLKAFKIVCIPARLLENDSPVPARAIICRDITRIPTIFARITRECPSSVSHFPPSIDIYYFLFSSFLCPFLHIRISVNSLCREIGIFIFA